MLWKQKMIKAENVSKQIESHGSTKLNSYDWTEIGISFHEYYSTCCNGPIQIQ